MAFDKTSTPVNVYSLKSNRMDAFTPLFLRRPSSVTPFRASFERETGTTGLQTTLRASVTIRGKGVHSGSPARITLHPACADHGLVFLQRGTLIEAHARRVVNTQLCTVLGSNCGEAKVSTVEHVLSALRGMGVDNAVLDMDGEEVPILDGSAHPFVEAIDSVGLQKLRTPRRVIRVLETVEARDGEAFVRLEPCVQGFQLDLTIDFKDPCIGTQRFLHTVSPATYRTEIASARTFGFVSDAVHLRSQGLALGSDLSNSVAFDKGRLINPEGLRYTNECVRHKLLDAIGDLSLIGAPLQARCVSVRGGHRLNVAVAQALLARPDAWEWVGTKAATPVMAPQYATAV
jgi:UDP-3-O-[3-hydroxymyristoyl] N-acetylglucosamine deacetylase